MAKVIQNPVSPIHVNEDGSSLIYLEGKAFLVNEDTVTEAEITSAPAEFKNLCLAFNNFKVTNEGVTWYHGTTRIKYIAETNKFYINNSEVLSESMSNHLIASGLVNYQLKGKIAVFEYAAKNHSNFVSLDFVEKIEEGNIKCFVMKLNEDFFVYRMNEANKIYTFSKLNANEAFDYIKEQTGHEITTMTAELLEGERVKAAEKLAKINVLEEMIAFLKDQRGVIAEADKSISEIKEADTLINSEIARLQEEIESIKNGEEISEGCEKCGAGDCQCNVSEAESDATDSDTMEDGEEAGEPAEEIESDAEEVDSDEEREAEGEEATDEAPEAEGEEGADDVADAEEETEAPEDESTGDQDDEVEDEGDSDIDDEEDDDDDDDEIEEATTNEDEAEEIEKAEVEEGEPEKAEEDQEELEASYDEAEEAEEDEALTEWAVRGMDAIYDNGIPDELRDKARKLGVRMTYDDDASPYSGALSLSSKNKKAILQIAAITGHLDQIKDGTYEIEEAATAEKKTNEEDLNIEEEHVDRQDGYVPGTLKYGTKEFAEGTEIQVDAEGYTTSGADENVTVFIGDQPVKVTKREIVLADTETI